VARPRSNDKRQAILEAAIGVIAAQGLSASTAAIAKAAGVANGSLFTYFETKAELWNTLYVELKTEMAASSAEALTTDGSAKDALLQAWEGWVTWAVEMPERRKVLQLLVTSDEITAASRRAGHGAMAPLRQLLERCRAQGPMREATPGFVAALMTATAEATIDFIIDDPANAAGYRRDGFAALWRMLG